MMRRFISICVVGLICAHAFAGDEPALDVLRLTASSSDTDPGLPWQRLRPSVQNGYAIRVDVNHAVTTERLVRNASVIHLAPARSGNRIRASVVHSDIQVNLALLRMEDASALPSRNAALPIMSASVVLTNLTVVQFDETDDTQTGSARFLKASVSSLPASPHMCLLLTLQTQLNVNGEGAPVLEENNLAGLVMQYDTSTRTASVLPAQTVDRFIRDTLAPPYEGFPALGIEWAPLVDPAKRAFLDAPTNNCGIQVLDCLPFSGASNTLQPNDVIMQLDGYDIDSLGYYRDPDFGRLGFAHIVKELHKPGDTVPVTVIRERKPLELQLTLGRRSEADDLVPDNLAAQPDDYMISGGCLIRELTARYLFAHGSDWSLKTDPRIVHDFFFRRRRPERQGDRIVIISRVLPDPINQGYQNIQDAIITHANGLPIRNMEDVFAVRNRDGVIARLRLMGFETELCFATNATAGADQRLIRQYRLPALSRHSARPVADRNEGNPQSLIPGALKR